ncbi:hypothetical protein ACFZBU_16985 [Embleya sp. NPDC008237]|uniref:hypothetical protein n=1 Tax=Embleya sp. NPDC008237 TaxID=3363978 RepID=UPI0036E8524B
MPLDAYLLMSALVRAEAARSAATAGTAATSDTPPPIATSGRTTPEASTPDTDPPAVGSSGADQQTDPQPPSATSKS